MRETFAHISKTVSFITILVLASLFGSSQVLDTFEIWVNRATNDSMRLQRAAGIAKYYDNSDSAKAWKYFRIAKGIADTLNTLFAKVTVLESEGILNTKNSPAKAYTFYKRAIDLLRNTNSLKALEASLNNNLGVISYMNGDYEGAINAFTEAVLLYEKFGDPSNNLPPTLNNIASTYQELSYPSKAIEYSRRAVEQAEKVGKGNVPSVSYIGLANCLISAEKYDSAFVLLQKAMAIARRNNNQYDVFLCYTNFGNYYEQNKQFDSARINYERAIPITIALSSPYDLCLARIRLALMQIKTKEFREAKANIDSVDVITKQHNFRDTDKDVLYLKGQYFEATGNLTLALEYNKQYDQLKDSLLTESRLKRIDFLEEKYDSDKKELEINELETRQKVQQLSLKQKSIINYSLVAGLLVIALVGVLIYRNLRHKQLLSKQTEQLHARRIKELEQEKQLISMNSLLKGQEEERGRLAKDLHDGLGGMLSGVKLSLGAMKGNLILPEDSARLFTKALNQLDNSIGEMRRVAHNMMPEALVRLGLQQAVQDYCDGLTESQALKISGQFHGLENRLDAPTEIIVYRIVQELLNNVVKHSEASEVFLQIMKHENNLNITVEDNGKGFPIESNETVKGAGLSNVRTRVEYLKGNIDIQSNPGKGTSIHIDCMLDNNG